MYRVLVPALVSVLLGGCSMANSSALTAGFADSGQPTNSIAPSRSERRSTGAPSPGTPSAVSDGAPKRYAKADDSIPKGSFEKAPPGALAARDYGSTQLDADKARDLINAYRKAKGLKPLRLNATLTEAA